MYTIGTFALILAIAVDVTVGQECDVANCAECDADDSNTCVTCNSGFRVNEGACEACTDVNCDTCPDAAGTCTRCTDGTENPPGLCAATTTTTTPSTTTTSTSAQSASSTQMSTTTTQNMNATSQNMMTTTADSGGMKLSHSFTLLVLIALYTAGMIMN